MPAAALWTTYAALVVIWSSTWVAIKLGLDDLPPLLGAGMRFAAAGLLLLAACVLTRRSLRTDRALAALLALLPFAASYGLIYWGEQYVPSGLTAVLFGCMPLYVALMSSVFLPAEQPTRRLFAGIAIALGGLVLAFGESLSLGDEDRALLGALAIVVAPVFAAAGNMGIKLRGERLEPLALNAWGMLGAGALLIAVGTVTEDWGDVGWTAQAIGSMAYLAIIGSAIPFVALTILLRHLPAVTMAYIAMLIPFGALALGAAIEDEAITALSVGGAALVALGIAVAQTRLPSRDAARAAVRG